MLSRAVNSERTRPAGALCLLAFAFGVLRPWEACIAISPVEPRPGQGAALGVVGGMRSAVAGAFWLRANLAWERQDAAATLANVQLAVDADGRPLYFWINGARMIAYDLPTWPASPELRMRRAGECARRAEEFLHAALVTHPDSPEIFVELALLRLRGFRDAEGAARWFGRAADQPGAPPYAARLCAQLLRETGRPDEALVRLRQARAELRPADTLQRVALEQRIAELELELRARRSL